MTDFGGDRREGRRALAPLLAVALLLLGVGSASGQADSRFTLVTGVAYEPGGPGPALVESLEAAGLGDVKPGACFGTLCPHAVDHPFYNDAGIDLVVFAGLRYQFRGPFSVEARISNGQRGHAEGYDEDAKRHLMVSYASFILSTTGALHLGPIRLEVGPALNRTGWAATTNSVRTNRGGTWTLGGVATVGGALRIGGAMMSLKAGFRRFPEADLLDAVRVPLRADYDSILIGLTVTRWVS